MALCYGILSMFIFAIGIALLARPNLVVPEADLAYNVTDMLKMFGAVLVCVATLAWNSTGTSVFLAITMLNVITCIMHADMIARKSYTHQHGIAVVVNFIVFIVNLVSYFVCDYGSGGTDRFFPNVRAVVMVVVATVVVAYDILKFHVAIRKQAARADNFSNA